MDVLDRRVVHSAGTPGLRVQCGFKDSPEDGGRDLGPVELCRLRKSVLQLLRYLRYHNVFIRKQPAVHIRKRFHLFREVHVGTLFYRRIKRLEKLYKLASYIPRLILQDISGKGILGPKQACILSVEAENQAYAKDVQALLCPLCERVVILRQEPVADLADQFSGRFGKLYFFRDLLCLLIDKEIEQMVLVLQIRKGNLHRLRLVLVQVIYPNLRKIRQDDPPCPLLIRKIVVVALGLFIRGFAVMAGLWLV